MDLALSPLFLKPPAEAFSSLLRPGGGVAVDVRTGERLAAVDEVLGLSEGVPGRLVGLARSPRSLRRSDSVWEDLAGPDERAFAVTVLGGRVEAAGAVERESN